MVHQVRTVAELENSMNSVERVLFYSQETPQEAALVVPNSVPANWPKEPSVKFDKVQCTRASAHRAASHQRGVLVVVR